MASVNRIDSVYDVGLIKAEQEAVEALVKQSIEQIKAARSQSIDFSTNTKSFDDYTKKAKELEKTMQAMNKTATEASKASIALAKQKEAEAKATLAQTRATEAQTKAQITSTKETERQAAASKKAADRAREQERPYKQLALAFKIASERAQDLGAKYGVMDKRAQAAAKQANELNNKLKLIDDTVGISNRRVGSYSETMEKFSGKIRNAAASFLALIGVAGVGSVFKDSIDEFIQMDKNVRLLQNTLNNLGVPQAFDRISASADRLVKQFTYLDNDDVLKTFQQLAVYGKLTEDQINELIPVIVDFAAATGQDLNSATTVIIKALEGNGKALKEYGINIKDAKNSSEAFGIIMSQLAPKVKGVGQAFQDSAAGGLASASQEFKNLKEEIGSGLLPILNSVLNVLVNIAKGAYGAGKALVDAFSGKQSLIASILGSSDNKDIAFEAEQVYKTQISLLNNFQAQLKKAHGEGRLLGKTEDDINKEFNAGLKKRLTEREAAYEKIKQSTNREAIMSALADIRGLQRALLELDKSGGTIAATTDPNKPFSAGAGKEKKEKRDTSQFDILKANLEFAKETNLRIANDEAQTLERRLKALEEFGVNSMKLIQATAEFEKGAKDLSAGEILKIENDKNIALEKLTVDFQDKLIGITKNFTAKYGAAVLKPLSSTIPKELQKILDDFQKAQNEAIKKSAEEAKKAIKGAVETLANELSSLLFTVIDAGFERQKNAVQDQIDLLEAQKQKDIELANQTITNASDRADAIAVIEARAAAKKQQLELKQRQLDQQKAKFDKAKAIAQIIANTAQGVMAALAALNPILAAIIGAIGAAQLASVLAQPIPRYKDGTENHPGGLAVVGDGGKSETVVLPDGSLYRTPSKDTLVNLPAGSQVIPDYAGKPQNNLHIIQPIDTTGELRNGFASVVQAVKRIPQPIIKADRAWVQAHKTGSSYRNYLNRSI